MMTSSTIQTSTPPATGTVIQAGALRGLILLQLVRLIEAMWLLSTSGTATPLPGAIAWGWSDIVIAATSLVALMMASDELPGSRNYLAMWNTAGIVQILLALVQMMASSNTGAHTSLAWFFATTFLVSHLGIVAFLYRSPIQQPANISLTGTLTRTESW